MDPRGLTESQIRLLDQAHIEFPNVNEFLLVLEFKAGDDKKYKIKAI